MTPKTFFRAGQILKFERSPNAGLRIQTGIFSEDGLNWYVQFVPLVKCCVSYKLLGLLQSNLFQEKLLYELVQVQLKTILITGYLMATL